MSAALSPVVPTTACTPCIASHGSVTRDGVGHREVDDDVALRVGEGPQLTGDTDAVALPARRRRIDPGDQRQLRVGGDGIAHGRAHPPARPR